MNLGEGVTMAGEEQEYGEQESSEWELDEDERYEIHEASGGDLSSFWDTEAGWVKDAHLKSLDELKDIGYPDVNFNPGKTTLGSGEKPLGSTGLDVTPKGLFIVWHDLAESWDVSLAKIQRINSCHGICIYAHDPYYIDLDRVYRKVTKLMRGVTNGALLDEFETSSLSYSYPASRKKKGGSMAYLTNRLGMVSKIDSRLAIPQTTAFVELSIASIMTLKSRKLKKWVNTMESEYLSFQNHMVKRKEALEKLYEKLSGTDVL
jgi:hypothetical protein